MQHNLIDQRSSSRVTGAEEKGKLWAIIDNVKSLKDEQDESNDNRKHDDKWLTYKN